MTVNKGIAPPDFGTPVGMVRANIGDTEWVELPTPEPGYGDYEMFSDDEIEAFLEQADGSVPLATAFAYGRLASAWNISAISVKQDDMQYSNRDSVGTWLNMAQFWRKVAEDEADSLGNNYGDVIAPRSVPGCGYEYAPYLGDGSAPGYGG